MTNVQREFRKYFKQCHTLKKILQDTNYALDDINNNVILANVKQDFIYTETLTIIKNELDKNPTILLFGQSCHAKALFINNLLDQIILPIFSKHWRFVTFIYGNKKTIRLTVDHDFEIVNELKVQPKPWITIPVNELQRNISENLLDHCVSLEIELCHSLLKETKILVLPDCELDQFPDVLKKYVKDIFPIIFYAISDDSISFNNIQEILILKEIYNVPFLFVRVTNEPEKTTESLTESEQHLFECTKNFNLNNLRKQLLQLGLLNDLERANFNELTGNDSLYCGNCSLNNYLINDKNLKEDFLKFSKEVLKSNILNNAHQLSEIHNKCLRKFILSAFDMARDIQITPKRILYVQEVELKLYKKLMKIAGEQQEEITFIIHEILQDMKSNEADILVEFYTNGDTQMDNTISIQNLVLKRLRNSVASEIVKNVGFLQEGFTGTLQRCLENLERNCHEYDGNLSASDAVKQILTAAYNIDLKSSTSFSMIHNVINRIKTFLNNFNLRQSQSQIQYTQQWRLQCVHNIIDSLSASKLAHTIKKQIQEYIKSSHEAFQSAIRNIENQLLGQLEQTEEHRITIRKRYAPRFAKLSLESTSLCDLVLWGMPKQIREIGRGQYGVVSSCESWADINPCAFKSVVPPDDRQWYDLAMEFYYTRTIPEHPRIVKLRGSLIDYTYGGGSSPAVLLVMERMTRDLHCGLKSGLSWICRLQIAIDVVEGIRYLHSQGLVHRDIKIKNVLLDKDNRAKLTDFGFCIPKAMMSGSIVGTPVHMSPELLSGRYDSSVDVYAFGILFWYICAGQTDIPNHFHHCQNKEQLWSSVRQGMRPECLSCFDLACWNLMEQCWAAEPSERPLLGYVQPQLEIIYKNAKEKQSIL